jgi:hypothetical protein
VCYVHMAREGYVLQDVSVERSRFWRPEKRIVDPVFTFVHTTSGVDRRFFLRVDVTHLFPMIANDIAERVMASLGS